MIHDNILIARKMFHLLKTKSISKAYECALKLNMNKTYDRVEWDFLKEVLLKLGLDIKWIYWVMTCVTMIE